MNTRYTILQIGLGESERSNCGKVDGLWKSTVHIKCNWTVLKCTWMVKKDESRRFQNAWVINKDENGRSQNASTFPTNHSILESVHCTSGPSSFGRTVHFQKGRPLSGPSTLEKTFHLQRIVYFRDRSLFSRFQKMNSLLFHFKKLILIFQTASHLKTTNEILDGFRLVFVTLSQINRNNSLNNIVRVNTTSRLENC